jgi:hypothetical protein
MPNGPAQWHGSLQSEIDYWKKRAFDGEEALIKASKAFARLAEHIDDPVLVAYANEIQEFVQAACKSAEPQPLRSVK